MFDTVETVLLIALVVISLALFGLVLIQQGKGADAGASFGGGGSQTVFGGAGSGNFLTKSSWTLAAAFFVICVALAYIARDKASGGSGINFEETPVVQEELVAPTDVPQLEDAAPAQSDVPSVEDDVPAVVEEAEQAAEAALNEAEQAVEGESSTESVSEQEDTGNN